MNESRSPGDVVLALVRVINGDAPPGAAQEILDPMVQMRMDSAEYRGIDIWYKWIDLIRNCGRVCDLRITHCRLRCDPEEPYLVHLSGRWTGTIGSQPVPVTSPRDAAVDYLVHDGRIKKIWTHRSNYEFIFGRWIGYPVCYPLFLAWVAICFSLRSLRSQDFAAGPGWRSS